MLVYICGLEKVGTSALNAVPQVPRSEILRLTLRADNTEAVRTLLTPKFPQRLNLGTFP